MKRQKNYFGVAVICLITIWAVAAVSVFHFFNQYYSHERHFLVSWGLEIPEGEEVYYLRETGFQGGHCYAVYSSELTVANVQTKANYITAGTARVIHSEDLSEEMERVTSGLDIPEEHLPPLEEQCRWIRAEKTDRGLLILLYDPFDAKTYVFEEWW